MWVSCETETLPFQTMWDAQDLFIAKRFLVMQGVDVAFEGNTEGCKFVLGFPGL
jgi:hypothetical protein